MILSKKEMMKAINIHKFMGFFPPLFFSLTSLFLLCIFNDLLFNISYHLIYFLT